MQHPGVCMAFMQVYSQQSREDSIPRVQGGQRQQLSHLFELQVACGALIRPEEELLLPPIPNCCGAAGRNVSGTPW